MAITAITYVKEVKALSLRCRDMEIAYVLATVLVVHDVL